MRRRRACSASRGSRPRRRIARGPDVERARFRERGFDCEIALELAQKTGFYFDQRDNRARVERLAARAPRARRSTATSARFALAAARGGAEHVVSIDSSAPGVAPSAAAIAHAPRARRADRARARATSSAVLTRAGPRRRAVRHGGGRPAEARADGPAPPARAEGLPAAQRARPSKLVGAGRHARELLVLGGHDAGATSCARSASPARDARREVTLLRSGGRDRRSPGAAAFPEGRYLKAALLRGELMQPLVGRMPPRARCRGLAGVVFDIDDTVTRDGALEREAFDALWRAARRGLALIAVTGRPLGWADVMARELAASTRRSARTAPAGCWRGRRACARATSHDAADASAQRGRARRACGARWRAGAARGAA